jgi:hypothetical protein
MDKLANVAMISSAFKQNPWRDRWLFLDRALLIALDLFLLREAWASTKTSESGKDLPEANSYRVLRDGSQN